MSDSVSAKLKQDDRRVRYEDIARTGEICGNCRFFQSYVPDKEQQLFSIGLGMRGTCTLVEGEINQAGVCLLYDQVGKMDSISVYVESTQPLDNDEEATGTEWRVQIINAGVSLNKNEYPLDVLHRDKDIFEKAPVHAAIGEDHSVSERGVESIVGFIKDVVANENGLEATLHISDTSMRTKMLDWHREGVLNDIMGLSIVAYGDFELNESGIKRALKLVRADSVDLVRTPAAGGKVLAVTESQEDSTMNEEQVKVLLEESRQQAKEDMEEMLAPVKTSIEESTINQEWRTFNLNTALGNAQLPESSEERIRTTFDNSQMATEELQTLIQTEKEHLASLKTHVVENLQSEGRLNTRVTVDESDKFIARLDAMFSRVGHPLGYAIVDGEKIPAYRSFSEAYASMQGVSPFDIDKRQMAIDILSGMSRFNSANTRSVKSLYTTEALFQVSSLGEVTADRMHKALAYNYNNFPQYQDWREIARPMSVSDYQTYRQVKTGTYADLAQVVEGGTYPDLAHITDEETTVQIIKRGGIVPQITRELIINDNLGAIADIPMKLATSAARTLYKGVFDTLVDNDTYGPDSVAIFHSSHGANTGTAALSISSVNAGNVAMRSQTSYGGNDVLGAQNVAKILMVPNELQGLANRISNPSEQFWAQTTADTASNMDVHAFEGIKVVVVDYWTDATDYFLAASGGAAGENSGIGVVFLNGNEEPELFTQSDPTQGESFTMDVMNIKIRHEWQKVVLDYRPFFRQVVA